MTTSVISQPSDTCAFDERAHSDFRAHVEGGWENVHPAIRARMDRLLTSGDATVFEGIGCVRRSSIGGFFAYVARLFGAPLVWHQGDKVRTVVKIAPSCGELRCWHRLFVFADGRQQLVQTTKMVTRHGLTDVVGANAEQRLSTSMRVWVGPDSLHFESTGYALRIGPFVLPIPSILTPGKLTAEHRELGDGKFRYSLTFRHPVWGETFYQDGVFEMTDV